MPVPMIVCGAGGRMGRALVSLIVQNEAAHLRGAVEARGHEALGIDIGTLCGIGSVGVPIVDDYAAVVTPESVTLDFTAPAAALAHLRVAVGRGAAIVIGTTGFDAAERAELDRMAPRTRSVVAPNMSVGVNVLLQLVATAARVLGDEFDPEIVEMHHRMKIDAPSGTALALGRAVTSSLGRDFDTVARFGRQGMVGKRSAEEIGVLALRGGDVVGDHTVVFAGLGERLELSHRAQSRECLARGAVRAALWVASRPAGLYGMADVLGLGDSPPCR